MIANTHKNTANNALVALDTIEKHYPDVFQGQLSYALRGLREHLGTIVENQSTFGFDCSEIVFYKITPGDIMNEYELIAWVTWYHHAGFMEKRKSLCYVINAELANDDNGERVLVHQKWRVQQ